ncbi:appetite-regulating hormone [Vombatus ursinus]|uniref:appetite-regulating hormone n=1 Tax=Vombatus ursinus TaxID=29139 RepID=UPI000FFD2431|nr:appetite-regulating hormone [Vombatus ursinus]
MNKRLPCPGNFLIYKIEIGGWTRCKAITRNPDTQAKSRPQLLPVPSEKMLPKVVTCSLLLLSVLWIDVALAGSSFLSPEHPKTQRKESKKPPAKLQPRDVEDSFSQPEGVEKGLEIQFNAPFDIGIKVAEAQYQQYGRTLEKVLQEILSEENQGNTGEN